MGIALELPHQEQGGRRGKQYLLDSFHGDGVTAREYVKMKGR
jgi:hypothetical protein